MTTVFRQVNYVGTDRPTINPASSSEPFYQEVQQYKKCAFHSLNHFAGRHIVNVNELFHINNEYYIDNLLNNPDIVSLYKYKYGCELTREIALDYLKVFFPIVIREKLEDVERMGGIDSHIIRHYMEQNKTDFNLPENAHMISAIGTLDSHKIQSTLLYIETHPIERVIFGLIGSIEDKSKTFGHMITIRKDTAGFWRVLDSLSYSFSLQALNPLDHMQPAYKTLEEALDATMLKYDAQKNMMELLYPSVDYTHTRIKPASSISQTREDASATALEITKDSGLPLFISHLVDQYSI